MVRECLLNPDIVRESAKEADVHLYYHDVEGKLMCVVVAPADAKHHFVVTTYFTKNIKEGKELWKK